MKILVTGSEGSLMQAVIPGLIAKGHTVIGIDKCGPHADYLPYQFIEQDIVQMTGKWHFNVDMIIHAAATIYGVGGFNAFCADIIGNDLVMTRNMLNIAMLNDVKKFVYLSSSMVYERCTSNKNGVEEAETSWDSFPVPYTDYGLSKYTGERMVAAYSRQYGLSHVIWRPFNIITPHEISKGIPGYAHVFADFFDAMIVKKLTEVPIISPGTQTRCFTWIGDVSEAIVDHSATATGVYNIGSNEEIQMTELAALIWNHMGKNKNDLAFKFLPAIKGDVMRRKPNIDKIANDLKWVPKTNLETSIRHCLDEYKKKGYSW